MYRHKCSNLFRLKWTRKSKLFSTDLTSQSPTPKVIYKPSIISTSQIQVGDIVHGFRCEDIQKINEFKMTAIKLKHEKTQTEYLHLDRNDRNNVFAVSFRTTPFNSTGLPHILEHTVLCGSKKFPVRDPFFKMLNRSISNFMNAMTGPDFTFYPFATLNESDFRNLQAIYLDAVFNPNLSYLDFLQEGWRLEFNNLNDMKSDLIFKGVVYNEMKGVFAENSAIFSQAFLNSILPDHTYGYVSGGDPLQIPQLTHDDLVNFHRKYYHPSNSKMYSYGNFSLSKTLEYVNENYLSHFDKLDSKYSLIPKQTRWKTPQIRHINSRLDKMGPPSEKQNQIAIGFLMSDITDVYETFLLNVLTELMVIGPNSYFYKSLIEPNISGGYNSVTGFDAQLKDTMFIIGLQNISEADFGKVNDIYNKTIDQVIENGFEKNHVESVLHSIELNIKHQSATFGLNLLFNLVPLWNHNGNVVDSLRVNTLLGRLRENMKDPNYLQNRVQHYFKNNNHKLTLTMSPDVEFEKKLADAEIDLLKSKKDSLTEKEKVLIYEQGLKLAEKQKAPEKTSILPCLELNDIPKNVDEISLEVTKFENVPIQITSADTNNVTYLRFIFNTSHLNEGEKQLIPLFNFMVTKFGTTKYDYRAFDQLVNLKTSGLNIGTHISDNISDLSRYEEGILFTSYALQSNHQDMFNIWLEILTSAQLSDVNRFTMLLDNYMANLNQGIVDAGHHYAISSSNGLLSDAGFCRESLSGLKHIQFMKNLGNTQGNEQVLSKLKNMTSKIFDRSGLRCSLNVTDQDKQQILLNFKEFVKTLPVTPDRNNVTWVKSKIIESDKHRCIHNVLNIPVNFCAKSISTIPYANTDFPKLRVLAKLITSKYLHPIVREQNGAYGSGAKIGMDGIFNFFSYRDPNSRKTLDVFDGAGSWFLNNVNIVNDQTLFEAKLGVLQSVDAPIPEGLKGYELFVYGLTREDFKKHRAAILDVTKNDLINVCEKYLVGNKHTSKCVLGPKPAEPLAMDSEIWTVVDQE